MTNDNWASIMVLSVLVASLVGMIFVDGLGYKKGVNETLVLCMENAKDCKIKYDYLKLEQQK